jgi:hypothetical protein
MVGGYYMVDCTGLDLTSAEKVTITGIWNKAVKALSMDKPIVAYGCVYGTGKPVSPVTCFGWYLSSTSIVIVGATLHIIIDNEDGVIVQDVASA